MESDSSSSSSSDSSSPPVWHGLAAGAASGLAARIVTFPTDTLKARLQIRGAINADAAYSSTFSAARHMLATEGPVGFYRGFGAVLWGLVPANLAYFGGYELGKAVMPSHWGIAGDMATGALAQVLAGVVYTPIDIVKERMQVQALMRGSYSYASPLHAFKALLGSGQGVRGLFRGYWATNCVWLPWNSLYIAGYEQLKRQSTAVLQLRDAQELPPLVVASCSAAAAAAAAVVTHPFDVVKTRLQVLTGQQSAQSLTAVKVAQQQLRVEGLGSFWHGLTPRLLNIAPGCALSWAMYEWLKGWLDNSSSSSSSRDLS
jgi:solute carrier family 25 citrate transporter 1